ncbi:MAG TPA: cyclic nucleotide-binding domain-containing protein [Myxococcales bacterium]|nr:cyclic nucleotide-binding domain-containing protein [Myxococcales bacterium]
MPKDAVDARELKDSIAEYLKKSKFDKAAELLEKLAEAEPKDMQHRLRLGDCYRRLGETVKSILNYDAAARQFAGEGHLIKAIAAVKVILEIDPDNREAQRQLAEMNAERRQGKPDTGPVAAEASEAKTKASAAGERVEAIELPEEPSAQPPAAFAPAPQEVTAPVDRAPTRGAQRGAMADRIQIELEPDEGAAMELEGVPKEITSGTEPILASAAQDRAETTGRNPIKDLPDDAILDPEPTPQTAPVPQTPAAQPRTAQTAPAQADETLDALGSLADLLAPEAEEEIELLSVSTEAAPRKAPEPDGSGADLEKALGAIVPDAKAVQRKLPAHVPLFDDLPRDAFVELVNRLSYRRYVAGEEILREGDPGRSFFVIVDGKVRIWKKMPEGTELELATLSEGAFFGEMALLSGTPRTANVSAEQDTELLEVTDSVLRGLARAHPQVVKSLKRFYRQRLLSNVMAISPLFKNFDPVERRQIVEKFRLRQAAPGEIVIKEGAQSDGLYVVLHGAVDVAAQQVPLAKLKEGEIFGEMSLLTRQAATATVTSPGNSLLLRLPRDQFQELALTHPQILALVSELSDQRAAATRAALERHGIDSFV